MSLDTRNLEPFKLSFDIYAGNAISHPGYYYISDPYNYNLNSNTEEVDMSKWNIDLVEDVYVQKELMYKHTTRLYASPQYKTKLHYTFEQKTQKLKIYWITDLTGLSPCKLVIKFYSLSQQREKLLNEIFTGTNNGDEC